MTKTKNRYNKKQRLSNNLVKNEACVESADLKNILQIEGLNEKQQLENDSNMLILPGKKNNKEKLKAANQEILRKKLTKRQRKNYEKVVEKKEKTLKREELLENLAKLQVKKEELKLYSSVKNIGKKEKRKFDAEIEQIEEDHAISDENEKIKRLNIICGSNKKKKIDSNAENQSPDEVDTDFYSTDEEINNQEIEAALHVNREKQKQDALEKSIAKINLEKRLIEEKLLEEERQANLVGIERKSRYIHVDRSEEVKEMRAKLPIITEEQLVMEKIFENQIVIICGETGSGKTTQTPQFLYEAGFAEDNKIIGITEPRRVAAISMSKRVAYEMNLSDEVVSYQIRYEANVSPKTKLKFMTDGVLLKEIQHVIL